MDGQVLEAAGRTHDPAENAWLEVRLGPEQARRRLRLEQAAEMKGLRREAVADRSLSAFAKVAIPRLLKASGMLARGRANATRIQVVRNVVEIPRLPDALRGYTLLHITDLHADISVGAMRALPATLAPLCYDLCVITGDFRGRTYGPVARTLELVREAIAQIPTPIFGVLGNHDTARIVPALEAMGVRMLLNECEPVEHGEARLWIAGVDDPHRYRTDDLARAMSRIPAGEPTILLAHSIEGVRAAAAAGVDLMLCGHTHGGQMCLPGSIPIVTGSRMPRSLASGCWRQGVMHGYTSRGVGTSLVDARFNCPPEVTLHTLRSASAGVSSTPESQPRCP